MSNDTGAEREGVAIISMVGRFPGASNIAELWQNLCQGKESISHFDLAELDVSLEEKLINSPNYVRARGIISDPDYFDAAFFGVPPREAEIMDPQQRIMLELAWEALESAGYRPDLFDGLIGVYAGMANNSYYPSNLLPRKDIIEAVGEFQTMLANEKDFLATRISHKLNLTGPSVSLYTGCSTSLVAIANAFHALMSFQCDMALAGGITLTLPQRSGYMHLDGGIESNDGHCRPFDHKSSGTVFSNGGGLIVLRRAAEALQDGDQILGIIRGAAVNNDGGQKASFAAPSVAGQAKVVSMAYAQAGVDPADVSYVETHGTATQIGDPIEIEALTQAFQTHTEKCEFCAIGSIKGNIGHLLAAAGVAGLIKTALILKHKVIPPTVHFGAPNPQIKLSKSPFFVCNILRSLPDTGKPRMAGVSSFGIGGTNVHLVLEEPPIAGASSSSNQECLIPVSGRSPTALQTVVSNLSEHLSANPELNLADVAFTQQMGRNAFEFRSSVVARNLSEAVYKLNALQGKSEGCQKAGSRWTLFVPGRIAENVAQAFEREEGFKQSLDQCRRLITDNDELVGRAEPKELAQFAESYALTKLWLRWTKPRTIMGAGIGTLVAACVSEVLSLNDAIRILFLCQIESMNSFESVVSDVRIGKPMLNVLNSRTGDILDFELMRSSQYWLGELGAPDAIVALRTLERASELICNVGTLCASISALNVSHGEIETQRGTGMTHPIEKISAAALHCLSNLWNWGADIDWREYNNGKNHRRLQLPTYPFERKRFWIDPPVRRAAGTSGRMDLAATSVSSQSNNEIAPDNVSQMHMNAETRGKKMREAIARQKQAIIERGGLNGGSA